MSDINVTPFVDVMLVLLIVFMVSAPLMTMSITVDLPDARGGSANTSDQKPLILTLKKSGGSCDSKASSYIGDSTIDMADLDAKLKAIKDSPQPPKNIFVNADKDICYTDVTRILGKLRSAGFGASLNIVPEKGE